MTNHLTRRGFLALGAAAVLAACRRASSPAAVRPVYERLGTTAVGSWFPEDDVEAVLVCLHGRGADERFAFESMKLHRFVSDAGLPFGVVSVDGGPASYWHPRRDGTDAGRVVTEDVIPWGLERAPDAVPVLTGWSMGGYGALLLASAAPERFPVVVATAPALWQRAGDTAAGAFDDRADFEAHDVFRRVDALRRVQVRLDCGADDPFAAATRALAARLPEAENVVRPGTHDSATWRGFVPDQLAFVRGAVSAGVRRRPGG